MRYFTLLLFFLAAHVSIGQCSPPTAFSVVVNGDLKITVRQGNLPMSAADNTAGVSFTRDGVDIPLVYTTGSWIAGYSPDQQIKLAASSYGQSGADFFPGPLTIDGSATVSSEDCEEYDQVYVIYKAQVVRHRQYFDCLSDPDCELTIFQAQNYSIPESFFIYPAHGDVTQDQSFNLAPYFDYDGNGFYDPNGGDYPFFDCFDEQEGCCNELKGDICAFTISNDKGNLHSYSNGEQIGIELQQMVYLFASPEMEDVVFNTTKYINRGAQTLSDTYLGHFMDADLGNAQDDLFGSLPDQNMVFFYNGDGFDENGFGEDIPVLAYKLLEGPPADPDGFDNDEDGVVDNEVLPAVFAIADDPYNGPTSPMHFYNWLTGHNFAGNNFSEEMQYPGVPDGTENLTSGDKKQLISSGPFTLSPAQEFCTTEAMFYHFSEGEGPAALQGFNGLQERADEIQAFADNCFTDCLIPSVYIMVDPQEDGDGFSFWSVATGTSYFWDFGDGTTSDQAFVNHNFPTSANYTVTLSIENECGSSTGSIIVNTDGTVGVYELQQEFTLFPQPANDMLNFRLEQKVQGALIRVSDMTGKIVMEATAQNELNQINTANLANGMYILEVVSDEFQVQPQQFIVRH
ncbi:MAG: hypothetical protein ACJAU0_001185 [Flavobacteriales bacterium]|jgi:hypothetical protein